MKRAFVFLYNIFAYSVFLGFAFFGICFIGNLGLTQSLDAKPQMPLVPALLIDGSLLFLFMVLRSAKSTPAFKRFWNKFVPTVIERPTNFLLTSVLVGLMLWEWQPIGRVVWDVSNNTARTILLVSYLGGWLIIFIGILLNQPAGLFGLKDYWLSFRNRPYKTSGKSYYFHKLIRNPFYLGMLICLWSASTMTVSHLFFAMLMTLYVFTVFQLEEKSFRIFRHEGHEFL